MSALARVRRLAQEQPHWFILGLVYLVGWWTPLMWMRETWMTTTSIICAQPLVLPGFLLLLVRNSPVAPVKKEGHLLPFLLGCLLYFCAHFVRLSSVAVLGLVLILLGVLFRVYGKVFLQRNLVPVLFLLLVIPALPEVAVYKLEQFGMKLYSAVVSAVLTRLGWTFEIDPLVMVVKGVSTRAPVALRGLQGIYAAFLFFFWYGCYFRRKPTQVITYFAVACVLVAAIHLVRFFAAVVLLPTATGVGTFLANCTCWPFTIVALWGTFGAIRLLERLGRVPFFAPLARKLALWNQALTRPLDRGFEGSGVVLRKAGGVLNLLLTPLIWPLNLLLKGLEFLFSGLGSSAQNLEKWLKKQERRRQRQREERRQ